MWERLWARLSAPFRSHTTTYSSITFECDGSTKCVETLNGVDLKRTLDKKTEAEVRKHIEAASAEVSKVFAILRRR